MRTRALGRAVLGVCAAILCLLVFGGCTGSSPEGKLTVLAAASTTDVVSELARRYERESGLTVTCAFASSSTLARQIEAGARFDVFVSANPRWMDYVAERELIRRDTRKDLLGNDVVLVAPRGQRFAADVKRDFPIEQAFTGKLAMGDPAHVPAGMYAKQALESLGWWVRLESRVIAASDVRNALRLVEMGEVGAGLVYRTDAAISEKVVVVAAFPPELHAPIRYPVALSAEAREQARAFLAFLESAEATAVFTRAGFRKLGGN